VSKEKEVAKIREETSTEYISHNVQTRVHASSVKHFEWKARM